MPSIAPLIDVTGLASELEHFAVERDWSQFHSPKNLVMALAGEVGELAAVFQWMSESDSLQAASNPDRPLTHDRADATAFPQQLALAGAALLVGLARGPHCMAMCGAASAAMIRIVPLAPAGHGAATAVAAPAAFHLGRIASYATAGAVAAASVDSLAQASTHVAALRPLWVLLHVFVFAWGDMLAVTGRQPL